MRIFNLRPIEPEKLMHHYKENPKKVGTEANKANKL